MVEVITALSMLTLGMVGIFTLLSSSYGFNRISTDEYIATGLAAEGIEIVRDIVNENIMHLRPWNCGLSDGDYEADYNDLSLTPFGTGRLNFDSTNKVYTYDAGTASIFSRKITLENFGTPVDEISVKSRVSWKDRGGTNFEVPLEEHLYSWRQGAVSC